MTKVLNPYKRVASAQNGTTSQQPQPPAGVQAPRVQRTASKQEEVLYDQDGTFNPQSYPGGKAEKIREALGKPRKNAFRMFAKDG